MVFSSLTFLYAFLPLVLLCWFVAPRAWRNGVLLLFSLFFYAFGQPGFVLLLLFAALSNWFFGVMVSRYRGTARARWALIASVGLNVMLLVFFKYADFFIDCINLSVHANVPRLGLPLPIGISFFLFQSISYVVDVFRHEVEAQRNPLVFSTYLALFPQLIAGPIVRYQDVRGSLAVRRSNSTFLALGIRRFVLGLSKKVILANNLDAVCKAFRADEGPSVLFFWLYAVAFTLQIYFDFSGYSDMAIGLGRMLGFHFPENFRYPYLARSITEFWRRWHITLGSWFRDYVYIPLGGNRVGRLRWVMNLAVVWLLTGLWHGAAWNFVLWGGMYGLLLLLEKLFLGRWLARHHWLSHVYVMFFVIAGFVVFNADGIDGVLRDLSGLFGLSGLPLCSAKALYVCRSYAGVLLLAVMGATPLPRRLAARYLTNETVLLVAEPLVLGGLLLACTAFLVDGSFNSFLYFRF